TYDNAEQSRVDGGELSASGKLTENGTVFAGEGYVDSEMVDAVKTGHNNNVKTSGASNNGNGMPITPKNSYRLWTTNSVFT
ncbi:TonB-dependent siderophore receptor, partial [Pseudomonas aeruginosa]